MADPDLGGGGGLGGHPDPEIRVWGVVSKKIYWPFWPQFGLKIGGLPPGSVTASMK